MLDHELLRTFVAVVDTGSFTRAAAQIFRSQSAVSMQMKRLEKQLEKTLFVKDKRELQLTDDGQKLIGYARRILKLHDEAMGVMASEATLRPLLLGCPDDYISGVLPELLAQVRTLIPGLPVQVRSGSSGQLRQLMDEGQLDLSVLTRPADKEEGYLVLQDRGVWVAPSADFIDSCDTLPLALVEPDCKFNSSAVDGLIKQGVNFEVICISGNCTLLSEMVRRGEAVSTLASCSVPNDLYRVPASRGLPELPEVEIVLQSAANSHPELGSDRLSLLATRTAEAIAKRSLDS